MEFCAWHQTERKTAPVWDKLERDDFRAYVRFLGRHKLGRAAIQLRFSALRTFYRFLIRRGTVASLLIRGEAWKQPLALRRLTKRLADGPRG